MDRITAQDFADVYGIDKIKQIIADCPQNCSVYRERIGDTVVKETPISVFQTVLAILGHEPNSSKTGDLIMQEFNFLVTAIAKIEDVANVSVVAETEDEAREIVQEMFDNNELQFETIDSDLVDLRIEQE